MDLLGEGTVAHKADALFYLTKEALKRRLMDERWKEQAATSPKNVAGLVPTDAVVDAVRKELRRTGDSAAPSEPIAEPKVPVAEASSSKGRTKVPVWNGDESDPEYQAELEKARAETRKDSRRGWIVILVVVALVGGCTLLTNRDNGSGGSTGSSYDEVDAWQNCNAQMDKTRKAPATAGYPPVSELTWSNSGKTMDIHPRLGRRRELVRRPLDDHISRRARPIAATGLVVSAAAVSVAVYMSIQQRPPTDHGTAVAGPGRRERHPGRYRRGDG